MTIDEKQNRRKKCARNSFIGAGERFYRRIHLPLMHYDRVLNTYRTRNNDSRITILGKLSIFKKLMRLRFRRFRSKSDQK